MKDKPVEELKRVDMIKAHNAALIDEFNAYQSILYDIRDFLAPRTTRFREEKVNDPTRKDLNIINSSPRFAVRTLPSGMQSGVTSPMRPWFRLGFADAELIKFKPVKEWVFAVELLIRDVLSRSNVYDRLKSTYGTMGTYGTSCFFLDEDEEDIIRGYDYPIGSFRLATSHSNRVDTMFRDVSFTVIQFMQKFGYKNCPTHIQTAYDNGNYYVRNPLVHLVEPNQDFAPSSILQTKKKYSSVWFDDTKSDKSAILKVSGFDYNPMMGTRWDILGEDTYGIGCGELAIGDAKGIQLMEKRKLQGIDKNVNPTMVADASLRNQRTSNLPGDTTYTNGLISSGNAGYKPAYQINPYIQELRDEITSVSARIDEAFYKNLFLTIIEMGDQPNITATQITALKEEKLLMLGPVLERLNDELLDPLIDAIFHILQSRGMIPPAPPEIQGMPLQIEYISILAQAQKAMGVGSIERIIGFVGNMTAFDPTARFKINTNETIDAYADAIVIPPKILRSNDEVSEMIEGEQQQARFQQMMDNAQPMSDAVKNFSDVATAQGTTLDPTAIQAAMQGVQGG